MIPDKICSKQALNKLDAISFGWPPKRFALFVKRSTFSMAQNIGQQKLIII